MPILSRRLFAAACALALAVAPAAVAVAAPATFTPAEFKLRDGSVLQTEEGAFTVPENRDDPASRAITIRFLRFKSTSPNPGAPIVYLAGGPGGSGIDTARGPRQPVFLAMRSVADVIVLDQRGTGRSNAIPACSAPVPFDAAQVINEANLTAYERGALAHCRTFWKGKGVAVEGYTTVQSADDIEALRQALGVRKVSLWGISYGTHLALATMRRHPSSIDRVALASVEGLDQTVKLPSRIDAAFARIAAASGDAELLALMRRVHARLDAQPQPIKLTGPDGSSLTFRIDSFPIRIFAGALAKNPGGLGELRAMYQELDQGRLEGTAPFLYGQFLATPQTLTGMPSAMDMASGVSPARLARIEREAPASLLGRALNMPLPQLLGAWPQIDLGSAFRREIRSDIPTLVLSGDLDVRTPLEEQAEATAGLRRRHTVIIRNGGHDLYEAHPDVPAMLVAFFSGKPVRQTELVLPAPRPPA